MKEYVVSPSGKPQKTKGQKTKKVLIIIVIVLALLGAVGYFVYDYARDFLFEKIFTEVVNNMSVEQQIKEQKLAEEKKAAEEKAEQEAENVPETVLAVDGNEYLPADGTEAEGETIEVVDEKGESHVVKSEPVKPAEVTKKPTPEPEPEPKPSSSTEAAMIQISNLTSQQISEIQALVTDADKNAVIGICLSALTVEDKREIKAMMSNGAIDYGRVQQILSARLSIAQKQQIYGYYVKYANMYFGNQQ